MEYVLTRRSSLSHAIRNAFYILFRRIVMSNVAPFDTYHQRYERWFDDHQYAYISELLAVRALLPTQGRGLEIGVGTGRFAAPLGVETGLDPSRTMLLSAASRGIDCIQGIAEQLPFFDNRFDYVLFVTTICFVDDARVTLEEARRVLKPGGTLVMGFIDRTSSLGEEYSRRKQENVFYRKATFYSAKDVRQMLTQAGFSDQRWVQTLLTNSEQMNQIEPLLPAYGKGAFVVVAAKVGF